MNGSGGLAENELKNRKVYICLHLIQCIQVINMATISVRVSDKTKDEIKRYAENEKLEQTSEAARKLLAIGLEGLKKKMALELIKEGKITFLKGAEIAEMNVWDFSDLVRDEGIVWIKEK